MLHRLWHSLRVYFGFAEGPDGRYAGEWGGVTAGAMLGMLVGSRLDQPSVALRIAVFVAACALGWLSVMLGRRLVGK